MSTDILAPGASTSPDTLVPSASPTPTSSDHASMRMIEEDDSPMAASTSSTSVEEEPRITILLREAAGKGDKEEIIRLLNLCDAIYHSSKPHKHRGKIYIMQDLPSDEVYTSYRKKYTPEIDIAGLYIRGAQNVRGDELIKHDYPMGSLSKFDSSSIQKLQAIFSRLGDGPNSLAISMKVDGVSMQVHFVKGHIVKAVTRFDHDFGRSVRAQAEKFVRRPDTSFEGKVVIDGEVILFGSRYLQLGYKNPRNGAAGILNRKTLTEAKYLSFIPWSLAAYEPTESDVARGWPRERPKLVTEQFTLLARFGYHVAPIQTYGRDILTEEKMNALLDNVKKANPKIPCDGLVVCPNTWVEESTDPPKMKVAYKGPNSGDMTTVIRIEPRATRTGNVIPQVYVEPVHVGGTVITSIAGGNYFILKEKQIRIGSRVLVVKAKEVIPYIEVVDNEGVETIEPPTPTVCPSCGTTLETKERMLVCSNATCPAKMLGRVEHFLDTIGVKGIGKKRIATLADGGMESLYDLYALSVDTIKGLDGFGEKTAWSLYDQLRSCINPINEGILLAAIGPPLIGEKTADLIVGHVHIEELFGTAPIPLDRLLGVKGIGKEKAAQLINFHLDGSNTIMLLKSHGLIINRAPDAVVATRTDAGAPSATTPQGGAVEVICLTGTGTKSRVDYEAAIAAKGWRVVNAVSQKTTIVVTNDIGGSTSKMEKARELGKRIITYADLDAMLN